MFINFPSVSLMEWHPFSLSSGPNEEFCEIHIKARAAPRRAQGLACNR
jgi:hypothetical protein